MKRNEGEAEERAGWDGGRFALEDDRSNSMPLAVTQLRKTDDPGGNRAGCWSSCFDTGEVMGSRAQGQEQNLTTAFQEEENAVCGPEWGEWYRFGGRNALNSLLMASISSRRKEPRPAKTDVRRKGEKGVE